MANKIPDVANKIPDVANKIPDVAKWGFDLDVILSVGQNLYFEKVGSVH